MSLLLQRSLLSSLLSILILTEIGLAQSGTTYVITTIAGNGTQGYDGDGGPATSARLDRPYGVAVDKAGNVYFSEPSNQRVRKVSVSGVITTVAGTGAQGSLGDGGPAISAMLSQPSGIAIDGSGNLYIADLGSNSVRKIDTGGRITKFAGAGSAGFGGDGGPSTEAFLNGPTDVAADASGNVYIADKSNYCIRKVDTNGIITTAAGKPGFLGSAGDDGPALSATLNNPKGVALDGAGNLFIADTLNGRIRKVFANGIIDTIAGGGYDQDWEGKTATTLNLNGISNVAADRSGNVYFSGDDRIWRVNPSGIVNAIAGSPNLSTTEDGVPATETSLKSPAGIALNNTGRIYIADSLDQRIRLLSPGTAPPILPYIATWILPSSARAAGQGGTFFTTSLTVANLSATDAYFALKFLGNNIDGRSGPEQSFMLSGGASVTYPDVLGTVFGLSSNYGAIQIRASTPQMSIVGQTSTPCKSGGSYGQSVPAVPSTDAMPASQVRSIIAIREDTAFRTNLILANATEASLLVNVAIFSEAGAALGSKQYLLPPLGMTQITRVVRDVGISGNITDARITVSTFTTGGGFTAYASAIDNVSGDPRTLLPQ